MVTGLLSAAIHKFHGGNEVLQQMNKASFYCEAGILIALFLTCKDLSSNKFRKIDLLYKVSLNFK